MAYWPSREFRCTVVGERRVVVVLVERAPSRSPSTHDAPFAHNGIVPTPELARRPWKMAEISNLLPARLPLRQRLRGRAFLKVT